MSSPSTSYLSSSPSSHPHHPSYKNLLLRVFRESHGRPLHLATIRSLFVKSFGERYWFPANWSRHVYQRLRDLEREGMILSSGPHLLHFSLQSEKKGKRYIKTSNWSKKLPKKLTGPTQVQTDLTNIEEHLMSLVSFEDKQNIEERLAQQTHLIREIINALIDGDTDGLIALQDQMERNVMEGTTIETELEAIHRSINHLQILFIGEKPVQDNTELVQSIKNLEQHMVQLDNYKFMESIVSFSMIIANLLALIQVLKGRLHENDQQGDELQLAIQTLEDDLAKSQEILRLREEQIAINLQQLESLKSSEDIVTKVASTIQSDLATTTETLQRQLEEQRALHEGDKAHYESLASVLEAQLEEMKRAKEADDARHEKELAEAFEQVKFYSSKANDIQEELDAKLIHLSEHEREIDSLNKMLEERELALTALQSSYTSLKEHSKQVLSDIDSAKWHLDHILDYMK